MRRRAALAALAAAIVATACRGPGGAPAGERVVSISPSTTEALFAIGAGQLVKGRSRYCDFPPEVAALPAVGGYADPNVEAILKLEPTLVVGARGPAGPALEQALQGKGIATYFPETESVAQIEAMLLELGRRTGHPPGAAQAIATMHAQIDAVVARNAGRPRPKAVLLFDVAPIYAAGPGGFPDELIRLAGGENLVRGGVAYTTFGIEHLLALDPDVILDGLADAHDNVAGVMAKKDDPGWRDLRAVREGRVRSIGGSIALRPGPRIGEGVAAVARALYGDP